MKYLTDIDIAPDGFKGPGTGPLANPEADPGGTFSNVISLVIGVLTAVAFIYFVIQFFTAALSVITAGGDKGKVEDARKKITNSIIGVILVISAIFVIDLIGNIIGIDILNPFTILL